MSEAFIKSQLVAFCKALNKYEAPLKQKHVRALILGTHKLRSARIFWHAASRIQLEKNPVLTWKFCQLLHKLIHDGHRKVTEESLQYSSRLVQLGNFWQHLKTSGYGQANTSYCKMLASRFQFHKKYPSIPGSLTLTSSQIEALLFDVNECYELAIDLLDQFDELLKLKSVVTTIMEQMRWSSLIPQGQCLIAPLILVILDTSKFYDFLVKALFKLHSSLPSDTLVGHRERFYEIYRKTKKFYEEASSLQYFKYLVSIPTLPSIAPNFQQVSELDTYQPPQAFLHATASSDGGESPPDSQSISDETIIDLSTENLGTDSLSLFDSENPSSTIQLQSKDDIIDQLRQELEIEQETRDKLVQETHLRIEQYENTLIHMKNEIDTYKRAAEERLVQIQSLQSASMDENVESLDDLVKKAQESEDRFQKMKVLYGQLRDDHIKSLTEMKEMRTRLEEKETSLRNKDSDVSRISTDFESLMREKGDLEMNLHELKAQIQNSDGQLFQSRAEHQNLESQIKELRDSIVISTDNFKRELTERDSERTKEKQDLFDRILKDICATCISILEQGTENLQNAAQMTCPIHIISESVQKAVEDFPSFEKLLESINERENIDEFPSLNHLVIFAHQVSGLTLSSTSAAYSSSIEYFEPMSENCRLLIESVCKIYQNLMGKNGINKTMINDVETRLRGVLEMLNKIPTGNDPNNLGQQFEDEISRMNEAIKQAVQQISELQKKSRANESGIKLEVNEKILGACTDLMKAVRELVIASNEVQQEILGSGKGFISPNEFYKRNHVWTEGLLSAARTVGVSANYLVSSADGLISGKGKPEQVIIGAQEIGASVAQLFISSRVKANKDSAKLAELTIASKAVNKCTAGVVAAVKDGQHSLRDESMLNFSNYSLHDAKKEEMECQIRTLELEAELGRQRSRLSELRKLHYHMASLVNSSENGTNG